MNGKIKANYEMNGQVMENIDLYKIMKTITEKP
jgi:hypothetical protein